MSIYLYKIFHSNRQMVEIIAPESMPEGYKFSTEYNGVVFHAIVVSLRYIIVCFHVFFYEFRLSSPYLPIYSLQAG